MKFPLLLSLVGITMAFPTPGSYIAQQNNEALTAAKNPRPQRHMGSQEPLYYETYHTKRSAPEYPISRREAPSYKPKPTYKPVKPQVEQLKPAAPVYTPQWPGIRTKIQY